MRGAWGRAGMVAAGCLVTVLGKIAPVAAQSVDSAQLMSIFNGLSSEQQQALMQQLGGAAGGAAAATTGAGRSRQATGAAADPGAVRGRAVGVDGAAASELLPSSLQPLKPLDTVLVEVEIKFDLQQEQVEKEKQAVKSASAAQTTAVQGSVRAPVPAQPAAEPRSQVESTAEKELSERERERLAALIEQIRSRNPYTLNNAGQLQLPGLSSIAVAGLNEEQATRLIGALPAMRQLQVLVTRLPLARSGVAALKPFGYDFFAEAPSTFAPMGDVPVPADYTIGAGDQFNVQLYGSQNRSFALRVGSDGRISFPSLGPIAVAGRTFSEVRADIEGRVVRQMIGTRASLSMGDSRSIRVFVMGEAKFPGTYTVSGLATVTGALFAAGGVKPIGSLRDVQVKRAGKLVRRVDLYDLLLQGDTSGDVGLQSGDVILIPSVGATVSVDGEVRRPAIYELKGEASVADLIGMAGGFTTEADTGRASLTRIDDQRQRVVVDVRPSGAGGSAVPLRNGDALRVASLRPTLDSGVTVQGEVFRPGSYAWREGLRLSDVVGSVNELRPNADQHYLLIRREIGPNRQISALSADLSMALATRGGPADVLLSPRDQVTAFDLSSSRELLVKPLVDELKLQATPGAPAAVVSVSGRVKAPGEYPLDTGMRVADLLRAGGGLADAAFGGKAELSRYEVVDGESRRGQVMDIDLAAALRGDAAANLELKPADGLYIKEISGWSEQERVVLRGEVRFPGTYPIRRGETLKSVLERAGGLTDLAFPEGAAFTRDELKEREQELLDRLTERVRSDLVAASLSAARANQTGATQTYNIGQSLLEQLSTARAVGRLVINLPAVIAGEKGASSDVILRNGDELAVPKRRQEVTVMGEVQNVTSHLYQGHRGRDDYIALSGGTTRQADRSRIYVVRADGSVVANNAGWLFRGGQTQIKTGDTIVVPLDTERTPALPMWQSITQILYNLTVAFAAAKTF